MKKESYNKVLILQTAFLGDVILATAAVERLKAEYPEAELHFCCRKGNEAVLKEHPHLKKIWLLDKSKSKWTRLKELIQAFRTEQFDLIINLHRFLSSGVICALSRAKYTIGYQSNPLSFLYNKRVKHRIKAGHHEIDRIGDLLNSLGTTNERFKPKIYPSEKDNEKVKEYFNKDYLTISPSSVWFTKQFPIEKWLNFISEVKNYKVYLLGAKSDSELCRKLAERANNVVVLAGKLSPLQSAALMRESKMNYVNDSAPAHLASAVNAPVTQIYCSTIPDFGFYVLSDKKHIIETENKLSCRPCNLHGKKECPLGHFNCARTINEEKLLKVLV